VIFTDFNGSQDTIPDPAWGAVGYIFFHAVGRPLFYCDADCENGSLRVAGERREGLGEKGMAVARALADEALEKIDWLLADEMVSTL